METQTGKKSPHNIWLERQWNLALGTLKISRFHLFKDFIYLFLRDTEREAERGTGSMQVARCGTRSQEPGMMTWAEEYQPLSYPGAPADSTLGDRGNKKFNPCPKIASITEAPGWLNQKSVWFLISGSWVWALCWVYRLLKKKLKNIFFKDFMYLFERKGRSASGRRGRGGWRENPKWTTH